LTLIDPVERAEPFDHPEWVFAAKFDGFRAAADTIRGRSISRNRNRKQRRHSHLM
jgi:ribosomal protein L34